MLWSCQARCPLLSPASSTTPPSSRPATRRCPRRWRGTVDHRPAGTPTWSGRSSARPRGSTELRGPPARPTSSIRLGADRGRRHRGGEAVAQRRGPRGGSTSPRSSWPAAEASAQAARGAGTQPSAQPAPAAGVTGLRRAARRTGCGDALDLIARRAAGAPRSSAPAGWRPSVPHRAELAAFIVACLERDAAVQAHRRAAPRGPAPRPGDRLQPPRLPQHPGRDRAVAAGRRVATTSPSCSAERDPRRLVEPVLGWDERDVPRVRALRLASAAAASPSRSTT